jgi:hypothetical protein
VVEEATTLVDALAGFVPSAISGKWIDRDRR